MVDNTTLHILRDDIAWVKVATMTTNLIDSSVTVAVLGQKFIIKVVEDNGRWREDVRKCYGFSTTSHILIINVRGSRDGTSRDHLLKCMISKIVSRLKILL
jgi:hypothetical protein